MPCKYSNFGLKCPLTREALALCITDLGRVANRGRPAKCYLAMQEFEKVMFNRFSNPKLDSLSPLEIYKMLHDRVRTSVSII